MKINLREYDLTEFIVKEGIFCNNRAVLVTPQHLGVNWNKQNKIFRSSIWDKEGNLLSGSFHKFVNWDEKPDIFPTPTSLQNCKVLDKIDGSAMICDFVNGEFSMRTRGTFSYKTLENANDFEYVYKKYPQIKDYLEGMGLDQTLLFEITTPNQKIVLDYGSEPDIHLLAIVDKGDYKLLSQNIVDKVAKLISVKRPKTYQFDTIPQLIDTVKNLKDIEGIVLYSNGDQSLHKVKATSYLVKHAFKENASQESVIDLFLNYGKPDYQTFCVKLGEQFDHECLQMVQGYISQVIDAFKEVKKIEDSMENFVLQIKTLSRKDQAAKILSSYGNTNRSGFVFAKLDNKPLADKDYKKLLFQVLKQ